MTSASQLESSGWAIAPTNLAENDLQALRDSIFIAQGPGQRCLLDQPVVQKVAIALRAELIQSGILSKAAVAIQAIAFDKTPGTNWKVTWHQDLMFPFVRPVTAKAFDLPTVKERIDYAPTTVRPARIAGCSTAPRRLRRNERITPSITG